jgi:hypothetical protein
LKAASIDFVRAIDSVSAVQQTRSRGVDEQIAARKDCFRIALSAALMARRSA